MTKVGLKKLDTLLYRTVLTLLHADCLVLSQSTRLTDGQTDGQTDVDSKSAVYRLALKTDSQTDSQTYRRTRINRVITAFDACQDGGGIPVMTATRLIQTVLLRVLLGKHCDMSAYELSLIHI